MVKRNSVLILTTNPDFPTNNHLEKAFNSSGYTVSFKNPYLGPCRIDNIPEQEAPEIVLNRCGGLYFDDLDLTYCRLYQSHGSVIINSPDSIGMFRNKDQQLAYLNGLQLPLIPSLMVRSEGLNQESLNFLNNDLKGLSDATLKERYILKNSRGQGGKGVIRVNGVQCLRDLVETRSLMGDQRYLIQPMLPIEKEYRIYFADSDPIHALTKSNNSGEKHNLANSEFQDIQLTDLPKEITQHQERLSQLPLFFYCVDWIQTSAQHGEQFYLLEVNTFPGVEGVQERDKLLQKLTLSIRNYVNNR